MSRNNFTPRTDLEKARASALASLSLREHSVKELMNKLTGKGYHQDNIDIVIDECIKNNYLNDKRFAEIYWRSRSSKGYGPLKITMELKMKGISESLARETQQQDEVNFFRVIKNVYLKKYRDRPIADFNDKMKRQNYLYRRGFDMDLITSVIDSN